MAKFDPIPSGPMKGRNPADFQHHKKKKHSFQKAAQKMLQQMNHKGVQHGINHGPPGFAGPATLSNGRGVSQKSGKGGPSQKLFSKGMY